MCRSNLLGNESIINSLLHLLLLLLLLQLDLGLPDLKSRLQLIFLPHTW